MIDHLTPRQTTHLSRGPAHREPPQTGSERLWALDPGPDNGHWVAEVKNREPAYDTADALHILCWALSNEAVRLADSERDASFAYADVRDYESAWKAHRRADRLANLADNLNFDRRISAPLFAGKGADKRLRDSMLHAIGMAISADLITAAWVCTCDGSRCGHGVEEW